MTREEAKVFMLQFNTDKRLNPSEHEAVRVAIQALSQEPCDDCIFKNEWNKIGKLLSNILKKHLHKSGKWIDREVYGADRWKCSECGRTEQYQENYCPNCGAKMESEDKECTKKI